MNKQTEQKMHREHYALFNYCRGLLYMHGMLTENQSESVKKKIQAYKEEKKIEINYRQLTSITMKYTGK
jgi:hypothetical protein